MTELLERIAKQGEREYIGKRIKESNKHIKRMEQTEKMR